jgi:4-amino-4-deoxy-L-arabinose transferase-like glycosyltransferase
MSTPKISDLHLRTPLAWLLCALLLAWGVGMFGRGYWTPDEPREADITWRMSWQADKAVPLLAGEAFCEKPPLTYWLAALPVRIVGASAWAARLPNLLYALITALSVGMLAARSAGRFAAVVGAGCISTFLLAYQVAIWLATDAPLLASVSAALLGAYIGFYAANGNERLRGYLLMHAALGLGFLCKSAVAWMVPALAILTLSIWERRWRELLRWELYVGLLLQAAMILTWMWFVYAGADGPAHLKVFFWNNLVGRFAAIDAPAELQYASAHRNFPGKYLLELPVYLFPWTLLVIAAAARAWRRLRVANLDNRGVRFGLAASLPTLLVLSVAATARNVYFAPALPGIALLVAVWGQEILHGHGRFDVLSMRLTAALLLAAAAVAIAALALTGVDDWSSLNNRAAYVVISALGAAAAVWLALKAWAAARDRAVHALAALFLAYCALLVGPASQAYRQVDLWQDLARISVAIKHDAVGRPLILLAPDETTRAIIDMYARSSVERVPGPIDAAAIARIRAQSAAAPESLFLVLLPGGDRRLNLRLGHEPSEAALPWMQTAGLEVAKYYSLPHGRHYALLRIKS